ncbi:MAG: ABC transporter ATP-binding protein [Tepidiforma sp.]
MLVQRCPRSSSSGSRSSPSWCWPGEATLRPSNPDPSPRPAAEALRIDAVDVHYGRFRAVHGATLVLAPGELVALLGRSGSGKTTLLRAVAGFERVTAGEIRLAGELIESPQHHVPAHRRSVGLVFQDPDDQLFSPTVYDDVAFGPIHMGLSKEEVEARVARALEAVGLAGLERRQPFHLSLGQRKRAALATVLSMSPELLVLDEPSAGLDPRGRRELINLLRGLDQTLLVSTHDMRLVAEVFPRTVILDEGRIVADGPTPELLADAALLERHGLEMP